MKKTALIMASILAISVGCQEKFVNNSKPHTEVSEFIAIGESFDGNTKTLMDTHNNILWAPNDMLAIFQGCNIADKYQVTDETAGSGQGVFRIVEDLSGNINDDFTAAMEIATNIAFYPYMESLSCDKSDILSLDSDVITYEVGNVFLPTVQTYEADSFGNGVFPMVAVTEKISNRNLKFKNILGALKLQLKGSHTITSIELEGNNGEKLSGSSIVTAYTNGLPPVITMSDNASTTVVLDCANGVKLSNEFATSFIIALPPILFSQGFLVTITDSENQTHTLETRVANTVLRSSILSMPTINIDRLEEEVPEQGDELVIPTESITLVYKSGKMYPSQEQIIEVNYRPTDATDRDITWTSDNPNIVAVDQNGKATAISSGIACITAISKNGITDDCIIEVISIASATCDYIDEYGINWGKGVVLGEQVWAPVNCGYKASVKDENGDILELGYPYGKLYQWGRKYGQGLGEGYDSANVVIEEGGVSLIGGQHISNANKFYTGQYDSDYDDWLSVSDNYLWNSGTLEEPKKTAYDPCPSGWRVPTINELKELSTYGNYSDLISLENGMCGRYLSGIYEYSPTTTSIFMLASGCRREDGGLYKVNEEVAYWSSTVAYNNAPILIMDNWRVSTYGEYSGQSLDSRRAIGYSVRCVQE